MRKPGTFAAFVALALSGAAMQVGAAGTSKPEVPQASIVLANSESAIRDWQADETQGIWVEDGHRRWYYAKLMVPCLGLDFATHVGFQMGSIDTLDRFSSVVVPGNGTCPFESFTRSEAPPKPQ